MTIDWKELQQRVAKEQEQARPLADRVRDVLRAHASTGFRPDEVFAIFRGCDWVAQPPKSPEQVVLREMTISQLAVHDAMLAIATKRESLCDQIRTILQSLAGDTKEHIVTDGQHYMFHDDPK